MQSATIYLRSGKFFVHAESRTTEGVWILDRPCLALEHAANDAALGEAVRAALDGSRSDVPHPVQWAAVVEPLLKLAGVKSWSTFAKNATCASIERTGETVTVIPTRSLGGSKGFQADHDRAIELQEAAAEVLGSRVRSAL